jgi:hypothetical protein
VYAPAISDQLTGHLRLRVSVCRLRPVLAAALAKEPLPCPEGAVDLGALGRTRTPNLLIRRLCHAYPLPAHSRADLLECCALVRNRRQL